MKKATRSQMQRWLQYKGNFNGPMTELLKLSSAELLILYEKSGGKTKLNLPKLLL